MVYFPEPADDDEIETLHKIYRKTKYHLRVPGLFLDSEMPRLKGMVSKLVGLGFDTMNV